MAALYPLSESHPFPMLDDDVIAMTNFWPGFSDNLTEYQIRIASYGLLVQHVEFYEPAGK